MQVILNISLVAFVSIAASLLLLAKLHRQLSQMIEGRIYQERSQNWPVGLHARYRASPKELIFHFASFGLLGITVGSAVYLKQYDYMPVIIGGFALASFYLLTREIKKNFRLEENRNRAVFEEREPA